MITAVSTQLPLLVYYLLVLEYIMFAVVCQEDDLLLPDGVNEGLYDDEGYAFYELSAEEKEAEEKQTQDIILCYTCHYSKTAKHVQGMRNCDEPFLEKDIPIAECEGSCAITKSSLDEEGEYLIIRGCLANCQNMSLPGSSVECCTGSMCNGRKPYTMLLAASLGAFSFVFTMGLMFSLCYGKV